MLVEIGQGTAAFALCVGNEMIALANVETDERRARNLAESYQRQHGVLPAVVPVTVLVQRVRPTGDDL